MLLLLSLLFYVEVQSQQCAGEEEHRGQSAGLTWEEGQQVPGSMNSLGTGARSFLT